jgi:hypothetical protein
MSCGFCSVCVRLEKQEQWDRVWAFPCLHLWDGAALRSYLAVDCPAGQPTLSSLPRYAQQHDGLACCDALQIPGTKRIKYLEENLAAASMKLTPDDIHALEEAVPEGEVVGPRYTNPRLCMFTNPTS